jgi:hypothetical protein
MPTLDSDTKQSPAAGPADPTKEPTKAPGENWESLRGLTAGVQKQHRAATVRTTLLALLLILTFAFVGWALHDHLPAVVNFGKQVGDTVSKLASNAPSPSKPKRRTAAQDQRSARNKPSSNHAKRQLLVSAPQEAYDPLLHPFYATALINGRRVFLTSNNTVIVLDIASGRWTIESSSP